VKEEEDTAKIKQKYFLPPSPVIQKQLVVKCFELWSMRNLPVCFREVVQSESNKNLQSTERGTSFNLLYMLEDGLLWPTVYMIMMLPYVTK